MVICPPAQAHNLWLNIVFVAGCFFLSGAAGLVYEVIWVRLIDKVIGSAPFERSIGSKMSIDSK
jgi:hypothetical protein